MCVCVCVCTCINWRIDICPIPLGFPSVVALLSGYLLLGLIRQEAVLSAEFALSQRLTLPPMTTCPAAQRDDEPSRAGALKRGLSCNPGSYCMLADILRFHPLLKTARCQMLQVTAARAAVIPSPQGDLIWRANAH